MHDIRNGVFLAVYGLSSGLLVSAGIFTVLLAVGLAPRFIGATHSAKKIFLYEGCIMGGAIIGTFFSVIPALGHAGEWVRRQLSVFSGGAGAFLRQIVDGGGEVFLAAAGIFMGMFVGCLALAIAEMLDSIPIFSRRISYRHGLGIAVLAVALGKLAGSLFYFWQGEIFPG